MGIIADKIRRAILGGEVRDNIADGIEVVEQLREDYDRQVINAGNSNAEIVDARGGEAKLKDRLDKVGSSLEHIVYQAYMYEIRNDGVTDNTDKLQNLIDSIPDGSKIQFLDGEYKLDNDINFKNKIIDFIVSPNTEFVGSGKIPAFATNNKHMRTGTSFTRSPSKGRTDGNFDNYGDSALNVEMIPKDGYKGNAVGLFISAKTDNTVRNSELWGANIVTTTTQGYEGQSWGLEIDANCHSDNTKALGIDVVSTGSRPGYAGYRVKHLTNKWTYGFLAEENCENAFVSSGSHIGLLVINGDVGADIRLVKDHIKLKTTENTLPTDYVFYLRDEDNNLKSSLLADGQFKAVKLIAEDKLISNVIESTTSITGSDVTAKSSLFLPTLKPRKSDAITKYLYNRITNSEVNVPANGCYTITLAVIGARIGDSIILTPSWDVPEGLSFVGYVTSDNTIKLRINNCKTSIVNSGAMQFEVICIGNLGGRN